MAKRRKKKPRARNKSKRAKNRKPTLRTRAITAARLIGASLAGLAFLSVLWVGVYRFAAPPGTLVMVERRLSGEKITNAWIPLEEISPHLVRAVIAAEDTRFCFHNGIDFDAIDKRSMRPLAAGNCAGRRRFHNRPPRMLFYGTAAAGFEKPARRG